LKWRTGINLIFLGVLAISAEPINLSGTVVSSHNKQPIEGVVVTLEGKDMADTTDAQGRFSIFNSEVNVNPVQVLPRIEKISMVRDQICFSLTKAADVKVELYDVSGKLLKRALNSYASAGKYRFNLTTGLNPAHMTAVRVSIGNHYSTTFRYLMLPDGRTTITSSVTSKKADNGKLAKIQAAIDSLEALSPRHYIKSVPVSVYEDEIEIEMDTLEYFSFFLTSLQSLQELSGSQDGFGGDLRFGKTGPGAGLLGADSICQTIAEMSMPGSRVKKWRAFLSVEHGPDGNQVDAIDRIGSGPWYDREGRLLAPDIASLLHDRPQGGNATIKNDFPNEWGIPNSRPDPLSNDDVDNHHIITGSGADGRLYTGVSSPIWGIGLSENIESDNPTCDDWTSTTAKSAPRTGFSWPQNIGFGGGGSNWISGFDEPGCEPGVDLDFSSNAGERGLRIIGNGGGYGGFYCFACNP